MIPLGATTRIFLASGTTGTRKGFSGLCSLIQGPLEAEPTSGHLFVFCNRTRDRIKVLYWDGSGLWLCAKRLENGRFSWPSADNAERKVSLSNEELALLLGGIELE